MTGTIWLPYVLHREWRNVYPCSFHHYNNMSKKPPLSRKACRNTKGERKNEKQQSLHSTWHYPWKALGTLKVTQKWSQLCLWLLWTLGRLARTAGAGSHTQKFTASDDKHLIYSCFARLTNSLQKVYLPLDSPLLSRLHLDTEVHLRFVVWDLLFLQFCAIL